MENYNRKLRYGLGKYIDYCIECGFSIREGASSYANVLGKLEITENLYEQLYRMHFISVIYIDAYKLSLHRQKECLSDDTDTEFLGLLVDIYDFDELLKKVNSNKEFLIRLIEECYHLLYKAH